MIKEISTQQALQQLDATHFLQISGQPVKIFNIEGYCGGANGTQYYIQLLGVSQANAVSGTTIPLWSRQVAGANGFSFTYVDQGGIDTANLTNPAGGTLATDGTNNLPVYVAISSTNGVYTSVAAATDVSVDVEMHNVAALNQTIAGDLVTPTDSIIAYVSPNPAKRLIQATITNTSGADSYVMLFASTDGTNGKLPMEFWKVLAGATITLDFGVGKPMMMVDFNGVEQTGCSFWGSTTAPLLTKTAGNQWYMRVKFTS